MQLETLLAIIAALGLREVLGRVVDRWIGRRAEDRSDVRALWIENRALRVEVARLAANLHETRSELESLKSLYQAINGAMDLTCPYDGDRCLIRAVFRTHLTAIAKQEGG